MSTRLPQLVQSVREATLLVTQQQITSLGLPKATDREAAEKAEKKFTDYGKKITEPSTSMKAASTSFKYTGNFRSFGLNNLLRRPCLI